MSKLRNSSDRRSWRQNGERQKYSVWILFSLLRCTAAAASWPAHSFSSRFLHPPPSHRQLSQLQHHCLDRCSAGNSPSHHPPSLAFTKHRVQRFFNSLHLLYPLQTFLHQKTSIFTLNEHLRKSQYEWNVSGNPSTPKKYVGREKYLEKRKWQMW